MISTICKNSVVQRIIGSRLAKDSFWAVFGNGLGYGILLVAGIVIARLLGKDLYGEYGVVKSTMLYIAGFATMGLGMTSTKYIAEYLKKDRSQVRSLANDAMLITLAFSSVIAVALLAGAEPLADYLDTPTLVFPFRILGSIIICKAINTTQNGILAGLGDFKVIARNNVLSGLFMLVSCVPLTYWFGLKGALGALLSSQAIYCVLNYVDLNRLLRAIPGQVKVSRKRELLLFSLPIALQESSYTICNWGGTLILAKLSSVGEVGIFTAATQWNAIITFIPGLLGNVVLSHLSSSADDSKTHNHTVNTMLAVNLICTLLPFLAVVAVAGWITSLYGSTFEGMSNVLRVSVLGTIFTCCANVFLSELIVQRRNWLMLTLRVVRDVLILAGAALFLTWNGGQSGAMVYAWANTISAALFIAALAAIYYLKIR